MYTSTQIANYFIKASQDTGQELTPMKLIKLSYIAHGWYLGLYDKALLNETIYAWKYGPVIYSTYKEFKKFGNCQINELVNTGNGYPYPSSDVLPFLKMIWDVYGKFSGVELSSMTHQRGTPWDITWNVNGGKNQIDARIPNDLIKQHYKDKISSVNVAREPHSQLQPA
jgi:uncharacterized phage-associated protein